MKPRSLDEIVGQEHILGKDSFLRRAIERDTVPSMILYGPPGCGKTSLAEVIARATKASFRRVNAVSGGIKDLREVVGQAQKARKEKTLFGEQKTILFIDEIHRFNKKQQDYLLPFVERGLLTLIGATTENPSFEVNAALLSRSQVFVLQKLEVKDLIKILKNALVRHAGKDEQKAFKEKYLKLIANYSHGDARFALNTLEQAIKEFESGAKITEELLKDIMQNKALSYDKGGEEHYNIISALHKSMRDSDVDASVYWTMRMVEAGEDPKYIVRRMIRFASEDVGNADPEALRLAIAAKDAVEFLGYPECDTALVQLAAYLAQAPKDNSAYVASVEAREDIKKCGIIPISET